MIHLPFLLYFSFMLSSADYLAPQPKNADNQYFKIEVVQGNKTIDKNDGVVLLDKKPFLLKITMIGIRDISVAPSWDRLFYDFPDEKNIFECKESEDSSLEECLLHPAKSIAEDSFNEDKDLSVVEGSKYHSIWFYDPSMDWHRFDKKVTVTGDTIQATITVKSIFDVRRASQIPLKKLDKDIYMFFAVGKDNLELQREKFVLRFR